MAEITTLRIGQIQQATLKLLAQHPEGLRAKDVIAGCAANLTLTPFEQSGYPDRPGSRRFDWILRFKSIPLVKAGWLVKSTGIWTITAEGKRALAEHKTPEDLKRAASLKYRQWKADRPETDDEDLPEPTTEKTGRAVATLEEAEEEAWTEVLTYLSEMPPYDFQELVGGLLRAMGYYVAYISPPGPDQGIDIIAYTDPLGVDGPRLKVQVKRRTDKISVDGVHAFMSLLGDNDAGIFFSIGGFTADSERVARSEQRRRIRLVDGEALVDLWIDHFAKIPDQQRRLLPLKPIYYLNLES